MYIIPKHNNDNGAMLCPTVPLADFLHPALPVQGKSLTTIGALYGVRRRWFGLEPDAYFRKRILTARKQK